MLRTEEQGIYSLRSLAGACERAQVAARHQRCGDRVAGATRRPALANERRGRPLAARAKLARPVSL